MKPHLLIIGPIPPPIHGESLALKHLIEAEQVRRGYQITVVNTNRKTVSHGGRFSIYKIFKDLYNIYHVWQETSKRKQVDILYLSISQTKFGLIRDALVIRLSAKRVKKIVAHLHGNNLGNVLESSIPGLSGFIFNALKQIDTGIVLNESLSYNFKKLPKRIDVVANGIERNYFTDDEIKSAMNRRKRDHCFTILYLSNLIEAKGFTELVQATMDLLRKHANIQLLLAGQIYDHQLFKKLMSEVSVSKMNERIRYLGTVTGTSKKQLLLDADVMVLPTRYKIEGQPISIIEGMAAGLPIISTNQGAIPELIRGNGVILKEISPSNIISALQKLIQDDEFYNLLSINSRKHFLEKYTLDNYINGLVTVFDRGLKNE